MLAGHAFGRRFASDAICARKLVSTAKTSAVTTSRSYVSGPSARSFTVAIRARPSSAYSRRLFSNSSTSYAPRTKTSSTKPSSKSTARKPAKKTASKSSTKKSSATKKKKTTTTKRTTKPKAKPTELQALRSKVRRLREIALLQHPKLLPNNGYIVYMTDRVKDADLADSGGVANFAKAAASTYRGMSESEKQSYKTQAEANVIENKKIMEQWIKQHTPDQIRLANNARKSLNRIAASPPPAGATTKVVAHKCFLLRDNRIAKKPNSPYLAFATQRWASGDFAGVKAGEAAKAISREWKALSTAETKRYIDEYEPLKAAAQRERAQHFPKASSSGKGRRSTGTQTE